MAGSASRLDLTGGDGRLDGYVAADALAALVARHALVQSAQGHYTLRATEFDLGALAAPGDMPVLTALCLAESLDPRDRGVALDALELALAGFRG